MLVIYFYFVELTYLKCLNEDIHANLNGVLFTHTLKEIKYKVTNVKEANLQFDTRLKSQKGHPHTKNLPKMIIRTIEERITVYPHFYALF